MRYAWSAKKAEQNLRKHGVSFVLAKSVFSDEHCLIDENRIDPDTGEQRFQAIGAARSESGGLVVLLLVVHVYREEVHGEEITRIISARAANRDERRRYWAQMDK